MSEVRRTYILCVFEIRRAGSMRSFWSSWIAEELNVGLTRHEHRELDKSENSYMDVERSLDAVPRRRAIPARERYAAVTDNRVSANRDQLYTTQVPNTYV